jgi:hypothetical protein
MRAADAAVATLKPELEDAFMREMKRCVRARVRSCRPLAFFLFKPSKWTHRRAVNRPTDRSIGSITQSISITSVLILINEPTTN